MKIKQTINSISGWRFQVFVIWIILTSLNVTKAYHIDDTFHLLAAENIKNTPCSPMSGLINWNNVLAPGYKYNQPPLFFYLIAATESIAGNREIVMHLMLSIFTFFSLYYFAKLSVLLRIKSISPILFIFGFCPALIVNQNLMTDVPVLSITIGVIYFIMKARNENKLKYYIISSILLSIGLLIKYSTLPLLIVIALATFATDYKKILVLLIPVSTLLLWSCWNFYEFGEIHILSRPKYNFEIKKIIAFLGTIGSISTFSLFFFYNYLKRTRIIYVVYFTIILFSAFLTYLYLYRDITTDLIISMCFILNGLTVTSAILKKSVSLFFQEGHIFIKTPYFIILMCIIGFSSFTILFAPFNATRHILLFWPFLLLFVEKYFFQKNVFLIKSTVYLTILLGLLLGISDWLYADFYRKSVDKIDAKNNIVWSIGNWGWQWYSTKAGMIIYSKGDEKEIKTGDLVVYPANIPKQNFPENMQMDTLQLIINKPSPWTFLSVKNGSMYNSFVTKPAWTISSKPLDTIIVCRIK